MKSKRAGWITLFCLCALLAGCIPHTYQTSREYRGRVLDARTGVPVAGAKVALSEDPKSAVTTGSDGSFHIGARHALQCTIPGPCPEDLLDVKHYYGLLVVARPGYQKELIDMRPCEGMRHAGVMVTNILLHP
jgi:hypothetical protein